MKQFEELYSQYRDDVYRFLYKLCGDNGDLAEELTQETFYHAYIGITGFKGECHVRTWLFQIAKNRYLQSLRKSSHVMLSLDDLLPMLGNDNSETICDDMYKKQLIMDTLSVVFSLEERMRMVFICRVYHEIPYSSIAKKLSISESSAKVLFHRAKLLIRERLKEEFGYEI